MKQIIFAILLITASIQAQDVCSIVRGAKILAQDSQNTYLGKITNSYDSDSIFNDYGSYGGQYSSTSIWNQYATFGGEYNTYSPFNKYTSTPPMMIKGGKVIGYITANKSIASSITPNMLKALCKDKL